MKRIPIFLAFVVALLAGMLFWANRSGDTNGDAGGKAPDGAADGAPGDTATGGNAVRKEAFCPVAQPEATPNSLSRCLSLEPTESPDAQIAELQALAAKPAASATTEAEALRWLIHQPASSEVVRNDALKTLAAWDVAWLVGDMARMMKDSAQSDKWRTYCVQHLGLFFSKHHDKDSWAALQEAVESDDGAVREQGVHTQAQLAMDLNWRESDPDRYTSLVRHIGAAMVDSRTNVVTSALRAVATVQLRDFVGTVEHMAGDKEQDLPIRVAAVQALGQIGRAESIPVLEACTKSDKITLARCAGTSLNLLKKANAKD